MTAVYFFQATFFVACLAIDQKRIDQQRNGFLPCFKHNLKERKDEKKKNDDESDNSNSLTGRVFRKYAEILVNPFVTVRLSFHFKTLELVFLENSHVWYVLVKSG